jgi:predicted dehydrogenase
VATLETVVDAARTAGRFFGSFEGMQRLHPKAMLLRQLIAGNAIGTALSVHQVGHGGLPSPWPGMPSGAPSWWLDPSCISTGAWLDHAIYAIDLVRYVLGGEIDTVAGQIGNRYHPSLPLEDYGIALMRLGAPSGPVSLLIEDTWAAAPGGGAHWFRMIGTHGWIHSDGDAWVVVRDGTETRHPIDESPFFPLDPLATALQSGAPLPFGVEDAVANLSACLRFYADARRDKA